MTEWLLQCYRSVHIVYSLSMSRAKENRSQKLQKVDRYEYISSGQKMYSVREY